MYASCTAIEYDIHKYVWLIVTMKGLKVSAFGGVIGFKRFHTTGIC